MNIDIAILQAAAQAGGQVLKKYFGQILETKIKFDSSDYCTKADLESEAAILAIIEASYPEANIHSEERGVVDKGSDYTIVIDPLDGTNNFVLGVPYISVCIGVLQGEKIIAGVIYNPILDLTYSAARGGGAWLNGQPIAVNKEADFSKATVSFVQGYNIKTGVEARIFGELYEQGAKRVAVFWSPGMDFCLLASGRIEGIINNRSEIYDYAAAKLIAREAGATITDFAGQKETDETNNAFVASNGTDIHNKIVAIVNSL